MIGAVERNVVSNASIAIYIRISTSLFQNSMRSRCVLVCLPPEFCLFGTTEDCMKIKVGLEAHENNSYKDNVEKRFDKFYILVLCDNCRIHIICVFLP